MILVISFGNFEVLLEYGCLSGTGGGGKKSDVEKKSVRMGMLKKKCDETFLSYQKILL